MSFTGNAKNSRGFTLAELSISMIIIGLLIVSILGGQALIKAAKIRSTINEILDFQSAYNLFQQTYGSKPGDIPNITDLVVGIAAPWQNGNGQGDLAWTTAATCTNAVGGGAQNCSEGAMAWRHLSMVGMVSGNFSGTTVGNLAVIGTNIPASKLAPGGYGLDYNDTLGKNFIILGAATATLNTAAVLAPQDARDIDSKIDDADPANGSVRETGLANCSNAGVYKLDEGETVRCAIRAYLDSII